MLKEITKEISVLLQGSTSYGVPNLVRSKHLLSKILWICFLITAAIFSFFFTYSVIFDFLEYKVITNIELKYDQPAEFPTITVCCENGREDDCLDTYNCLLVIYLYLFPYVGFTSTFTLICTCTDIV